MIIYTKLKNKVSFCLNDVINRIYCAMDKIKCEATWGGFVGGVASL